MHPCQMAELATSLVHSSNSTLSSSPDDDNNCCGEETAAAAELICTITKLVAPISYPNNKPPSAGTRKMSKTPILEKDRLLVDDDDDNDDDDDDPAFSVLFKDAAAAAVAEAVAPPCPATTCIIGSSMSPLFVQKSRRQEVCLMFCVVEMKERTKR
jgi:hypothetical protein